MPQMFEADASPEKRLFISLITRDISLSDAIIDLLDNTVNAAMRPIRNSFASTDDFRKLFDRTNVRPNVTIRVTFDRNGLTVVDDACGIDFESAQHEVFRFGHSGSHDAPRDRLSVYGIGMKRALFKIGRQITITSDHATGGFGLSLNVRNWARNTDLPWTIPISKRPPRAKTGTTISIGELNPEVRTRLADRSFEQELIQKISKVYSYFIGRIVDVYVNTKPVTRTEFEIGGENFSHDRFKRDSVDCSILAGIAKPTGDRFLAETAGWFVFCNYRTVLYGDKSQLTGWGAALPIFQPKHRPFLGIVLFA
ncbi:MAG: ATP-binding protein, partial [Rhizomicrobium sp.]